MPFQIHQHLSAAAFLQRAEGWLLRAEAEYNLLLGLARRLTESTAAYDPPIYLATVEQAGTVVGCAFRTPPFKLGLTRMPAAAIPALADDVAVVYATLPAVLGPEPEVQAFAARWSERKGVAAGPGMRQRIYELDAVTPPARPPPGYLRAAVAEDVPLVADWIAAFAQDTRVQAGEPRSLAEGWIDRGALHLWIDGEPVSMAGSVGRTPNGARVGYVYTPPSRRRLGYASACVAALSQHLLDTGHRFCFLYTDLSNPTSNHIYQQLGYRPVCDVIDYWFEHPA